MSEHRIDILISRILDRAETPEEWTEFRSMASAEPSAWEMLAEAQRDDARLRTLALEATDAAELVALPAGLDVAPPLSLRGAAGPAQSRQQGLFRSAGWAAAACLAVAWIASGPLGVNRAGPGVQQAGLFPGGSADDAFSEYLDRGQRTGIVVAEVEPRVLLTTRALDSGGYEVTFVRQVIERREVPTLLRLSGTDEIGQATPVIVHPSVASREPARPD